MHWECGREPMRMTKTSRLWPATSQSCYVWWPCVVHDNAQGRAPSPWDPLPCEKAHGCPRQATVGAACWCSELSALPRTPNHIDVGRYEGCKATWVTRVLKCESWQLLRRGSVVLRLSGYGLNLPRESRTETGVDREIGFTWHDRFEAKLFREGAEFLFGFRHSDGSNETPLVKDT